MTVIRKLLGFTNSQDSSLDSLYGIRAIGCFMVILNHCYFVFSGYTHISYSSFKYWVSHAHIAIDVFFLLSAFLLSFNLIQKKEKSGNFDFKIFFVKRSFKILPSFYLFFFLNLILILATYKNIDINSLRIKCQDLAIASQITECHLYFHYENIQYWYRDFFFISNFSHHRLLNHGWSLSSEEQFYLVLPILLILLFQIKERIYRVIVLFLLIILAFFLRVWIVPETNITEEFFTNGLFHPIYSHYDSFLYGLILAELYPNLKTISLPLINFISILFLIFTIFSLGFFDHEKLTNLTGSFLISWYGVLCFVFVILAIQPKGILNSFLRNPLLVNIGKMSYGIYLYHMISSGLGYKYSLPFLAQDPLLFFLVGLVFTSFFAILYGFLNYLFIERTIYFIKEIQFYSTNLPISEEKHVDIHLYWRLGTNLLSILILYPIYLIYKANPILKSSIYYKEFFGISAIYVLSILSLTIYSYLVQKKNPGMILLRKWAPKET